ncbi:MAG: ABC transporter permease [Anaerolineales bacterium]
MSSLRQSLQVIRLSAEMALRHAATDSFVIFAVFVQPLIIAVLGLLMLRERGADYGVFVVVGSGLTGLWSSLLFVSGNAITNESWTGTLEGLVGMPTPLWMVVLGKNLAHVLQSLGSMVLAYVVVSLLTGYPITIAQPWAFAASTLFVVISFVCFGLLLSPLFIVNPDVQRFQNGLEYPVYILSGFLFPILLLPGWTNPLSYILAPYWAARSLHSAAAGEATMAGLALDWGVMILLSVLYLLVSAFLFRRMLEKARRDATLGFQ